MDFATFHLVVIRGFKTAGEGDGLEHHFSERFPHALIDSYDFIEHRLICFERLQSLAGEVLEKLLHSRANYEKKCGPSQPLPVIFLGRGLGGYLVKQVIVLATEESRYYNIFRNTSSALFYGTLCRALTVEAWESQLFSLISDSGPSLRASLKLFDFLIDDLNNVSFRFSAIACSINIIECCAARSKETEETIPGHRPCVSDTANQEEADFPCPHNRAWKFEGGDTTTEEVCRSVRAASESVQTPLHDFIRLLLLLNPRTRHLRADTTEPQNVAWIQSHQSYLDWRLEQGVSILHVVCPNEEGTIAFSSHVLELLELHPETSKSTLLSFSFSKSDAHSTSAFDLYVSLCRQLLSARPHLFEHIASASKFFADSCILTAEVFWILFCSLVIRILEQEEIIYCLIGTIDDCSSFYDEIINRMTSLSMDFPGQFKLLFAGINPSPIEHHNVYCRDIDFHGSVTASLPSLEPHFRVQTSRGEIIRKVINTADSERPLSTSDQSGNMRLLLLERITTRSTRRAIQDNLNTLPGSIEEIYNRTIGTIREPDLNWVSTALRWILYARRPLKSSELAVAIAVDEITGTNMSTLNDSIARDILGDLRQCIGLLLRVNDDKIYPIHEGLRALICQNAPARHAQSPDVHLWMLKHCLDYLQKILPCISSEDVSTGSEFGFLTYACTHWPEHFRCVGVKTDAHAYVLEFLENAAVIKAWAELYCQLQPPLLATAPSLTSPLNVVCNFGLVELVKDVVSEVRGHGSFDTELTESLDLAVRNGHISVVQLLLNEGVTSPRALGLAAVWGFGDIAQSVLAVDSCLETPDSDGYTPIHLSVCAGNDKMVALLLEKGADPTRRVDGDGNTALHLAAEYGHSEVTKALLGVIHDVTTLNNNGMSAADIAAFRGHFSTLRQILDVQNEGQNQDDSVGKDEAKQESSLEVFILGACHHRSILEWAAKGGHAHIVKYLTMVGLGHSHADRSFALLLAAEEGHVAVVKQLLSTAMNTMAVDSHQNSPLHAAASSRSSLTITQLLKDPTIGQHTNAENEGGLTALHVAIESGHLGAVVELLRYNAKVDIKTSEEDTVFHLAVRNNRYDILVELLRNPVAREFFDSKNNSQMTPLHFGAEAGLLKIVNALLEHGADVNLCTESEDTALHLAARRGHLEVVQSLCAAMNTIWVINDEGHTPLDESILNGETRIAREFILVIGKEAEERLSFKQGETLHLAAEKQDEELFSLLLDKGMDCTTYNRQGYTPLHVAAASSFIAGIKMLLARPSINVNIRSKDGATPLHVAASSGHVQAVGILLDCDADINTRKSKLPSPLFIASYTGQVEVVKALLASRQKPNLRAKGYGGWYPIHGAYDNAMITQLLLEAGTSTTWLTEDRFSPLALACTYGYAETVKVLLEGKADPNFGGDGKLPPLHMASLSKRGFEVLKLLIAAGATKDAIDGKGSTSLHLAASSASQDAIHYLLDQGLDVHAKSEEYGTILTAYMTNSEFSSDFADSLLEKGIDVNDINGEYHSALHAACAKGHPDAVLWLLNHGADVRITGGRYATPLHAAFESDEDTFGECVTIKVQALLDKGADVNAVSTQGTQPIHMAAAKGQIDLLKLLVGYGADPLSKDRNGRSVLMHAVARRQNAVIDHLLETKNVDTAELDITARTPLMMAVLKADVEIVDRLLRAGYARTIDAQDAEGKTALMHAVSRGNIDVANKVLETDADPRILDGRQRSALYWAARTAPMELLERIIEALARFDSCSNQIEGAIHGAIASKKRQSLRRLMNSLEMPLKQASPDGWTPAYTAKRYDLSVEALGSEQDETSFQPALQSPSAWHPQDRTPCLQLEPDEKHITVALGPRYLNSGDRATARANHPMWPMIDDAVYYFEIRIIKAPQDKIIGIGFCEDRTPLDRMVGWDTGSWGYHGDDGKAFNQQGWGSEFGTTYEEGDVVGCGVNYREKTAFYTKNGNVIGRAFTEIKGKLYPAVSFTTDDEGAQIAAVFGNDSCSNFCFKGPYNSPATLKPPELTEEDDGDSEKSGSTNNDSSMEYDG